MTRKHIIFYGRVQGVGFRYKAYHIARNYGLTGYVRNNYDGTVEMEVQGAWDKIAMLIGELDGDRYIHIDDMDVEVLPVKPDEKGFGMGGY